MKINVNNPSLVSVTTNPVTTAKVNSVGIQGPPGPAGIQNISEASDVDRSNLANGSLLIYKATTEKWTASTNLDAQNMDGGHF